ncbi:MAG TPA: GNAT family N-acetyltransferase [Blastocatellia bacterium]|nr:GNAT family N-acetyltransferase [Blastocatellia bacterium]
MSKTGEEGPLTGALSIRPARKADAPELARLMAEAISWGRLNELGRGFSTLMHLHLIDSRHAICYVAERDGEIVGYVAGATDTSKFYREFLWRRGLIAAIKLAPKIFQSRHRQTIIRSLTYFPEAYPDDPPAEMLSFAVRPRMKQSGVGKAIFAAISAEFKARGVTAIKFGTTESSNETANAFYRRLGFELVRTAPFYENSQVNVYVYRIV